MSDYGPPHSDFPWKPLILCLALSHCIIESLIVYHQRNISERARSGPAITENDQRQEAWRRFRIFKSVLFMLEVIAFFSLDIAPAMWSVIAGTVQGAFDGESEGPVGDAVCFALCCLAAWLHIRLLAFCRRELFEIHDDDNGEMTSRLRLLSPLLALHNSPIWLLLGSALFASGLRSLDPHSSIDVFPYVSGFMVTMVLLLYDYLQRPPSATLLPMEDEKHRREIQDVATASGYPLKEIYDNEQPCSRPVVIFGWPRRRFLAVRSDLKETLSIEEIVALVAQEIGYWKRGGDLLLAFARSMLVLIIQPCMSAFLENPDVYAGLGFWSQPSVYPGIILFGMSFAPILQAACTFVTNALYHRLEMQADAFACRLGYGAQLASALTNLEAESSASFNVDWISSVWLFAKLQKSEHLQLIRRLMADAEVA